MSRFAWAALAAAVLVLPAAAETLDEAKAAAVANCAKEAAGQGVPADKVDGYCACVVDGAAGIFEDEAKAIAFIKLLSANPKSPAEAAQVTGMSEADTEALMAEGLEKFLPFTESCKS